jgi:hypothetical protein
MSLVGRFGGIIVRVVCGCGLMRWARALLTLSTAGYLTVLVAVTGLTGRLALKWEGCEK